MLSASRFAEPDLHPDACPAQPGDSAARYPGVGIPAAHVDAADPGLDDGYHVQLFTDSAAQSAKQGVWMDLSGVESEIQ
jgi:hypothetical protein